MSFVNDFAMFGSVQGFISVYTYQKSGQSQEKTPLESTKFVFRAVPVDVGKEPPYVAHSGPVTLQGLKIVKDGISTQSTPCSLFAAAWSDGRLCICEIARHITSDGNELQCWFVQQCFETNNSFFDIHILEGGVFDAIAQSPDIDINRPVSNGKVHNTSISDDADVGTMSRNHRCTMTIVAAARNGKVVMVSISPSKALATCSVIGDYPYDIYCFDSQHRVKGNIVQENSDDDALRYRYDMQRGRYWQGVGSLRALCCGRKLQCFCRRVR